MNAWLEDIAGTSNPMVKRTKTGLLTSLISPINLGAGQAVKVDQGNGKRKTVKVQYWNRRVEADVLTSEPADCVTTDESCLNETEVDIAQDIYIEENIQEAYWARLCAGDGTLFNQIVGKMFEAMNRKLNNLLITSASTTFGVNQSTGLSTVVTKDLYNDATGAVNAQEWIEVSDELMNSNQFTASPIIAAGSGFYKFNAAQKMGCCNDAGVDLQALTTALGYSYFNDQQIDTVLGANEAVVYEPGALKLLTWYRYRELGAAVLKSGGAYAAFDVSDGTMRGIVRDPVTGMAYEIKVIADSCGDTFYLRLSLHFDLWSNPHDMYDAADHLALSNGVLYYKFT